VIWRFFLFKEFKKYPLFFLLISLTLLIGSVGLVGISIISHEIKFQLSSRAQELLTSDFSVSARRRITPDELTALDEILRPRTEKKYRVLDLYSMVSFKKNKQSRLVEIRGVEHGFPFYGKIKTRSGALFEPGNAVYASKELTNLWGLNAGDKLLLGGLELEVRDVILEDSSVGIRGVSLAPRLYVPLENLEKTGLTKSGSIGTHSVHIKLKELSLSSIKDLKSKVYTQIKDPALKVVLPENTSEQTGRAFEIISNFMSLSALIGFILALIGVFYLYQSHLFFRLKDFSLLILHGVKKEKIFFGLISQLVFVFLIVLIFQMAVVSLGQSFFLPYVESFLGFKFSSLFNLVASIEQMFFLFLLCVGALLPLFLGVFRSSLMTLLKSQKLTSGNYKFWDFVPFIIMFWFYSWYLSNSLKIGSIFSFSLIAIFLISFFLIQLIQKFLQKIILRNSLRFFSLEFGISLRNLARSGHKLTLSSVALTLGATLITFILQLDSLIMKELELNRERPGLFIFDIQEEQKDPFISFSKTMGAEIKAITPMVRGRILKVNDVEFKKPKANLNLRKTFEDDVENRSRNSSVNLTFRDYLTPSEKIVEGVNFNKANMIPEIAPLSLEKRWAQRMGVKLKDKILFDIQGVEFEGVVVNIKEIKWTDFYPNFFITVAPGYIDEAPKTFLAILPSSQKDKKVDFQVKSISAFPNISFIDVEEAIEKLAEIFKKSKTAISSITFLSLIVGLIILYALSFDQIFRRYYEIALFKALGLLEGKIRRQVLLEFSLLFLFSLMSGFFFGWVLAQAIGKEIFKLDFSYDFKSLVFSFLFLSLLSIVTILISSLKALKANPRDLLAEG